MKKPATFEEIKASIRRKEFYPVYAFYGEEEYFIDQLAGEMEEHCLDESEKAFNMSVVYGADTTVESLRDMATRLPMMAPRQVVIVREAQLIRGLTELESYVQRPASTTLLVLCHKHKKIDKRTTFYKAIQAHGIAFESSRLYENKVGPWITSWVNEQGFDIAPEAAALAMELIGIQLNKLSNELSKVLLSKPKGHTITVADLQDSVGISREFNVFELQKAMSFRKTTQVFFIAHQMTLDIKNNHPIMVIGSMYNYFVKLYTMHQLAGANDKELGAAMGVNPFFMNEYKQAARHFNRPRVEHIIGILSDFDLRTKGVNNRRWKDEDLIIELVHRIMAA